MTEEQRWRINMARKYGCAGLSVEVGNGAAINPVKIKDFWTERERRQQKNDAAFQTAFGTEEKPCGLDIQVRF